MQNLGGKQGAATNTSTEGGAHGDLGRCKPSPLAQGMCVGQHLILNLIYNFKESGWGASTTVVINPAVVN